jgi:hypothetical protein
MSFPLVQDVMATIAAALALAWIVRHVARSAPPASNPLCNGCPLKGTDPRPVRYSRKP